MIADGLSSVNMNDWPPRSRHHSVAPKGPLTHGICLGRSSYQSDLRVSKSFLLSGVGRRTLPTIPQSPPTDRKKALNRLGERSPRNRSTIWNSVGEQAPPTTLCAHATLPAAIPFSPPSRYACPECFSRSGAVRLFQAPSRRCPKGVAPWTTPNQTPTTRRVQSRLGGTS